VQQPGSRAASPRDSEVEIPSYDYSEIVSIRLECKAMGAFGNVPTAACKLDNAPALTEAQRVPWPGVGGEMEPIYSAVIMAVILGAVQFFSERISEKCGRYYIHVTSFSAGVSTAYLLLDLIPHFSHRAVQISRFLFLSLLGGFVVIHLVEKYIYQHSSGERRVQRLGIENLSASFAYHFILGIVIFDFTARDIREALLLFVPILIFTGVSTLPLHRHHSAWLNLFLSSSTLTGVLFAGIAGSAITPAIQAALLGFILGSVLFSVIRHSLPMGTEGKPVYFLLGVIVYSPLVMAGWSS